MKINLEDFKNELAKDAFGMGPAQAHEKGVCISCGQPPRFKTEAGIREYRISAMCEYCFDQMFEEE